MPDPSDYQTRRSFPQNTASPRAQFAPRPFDPVPTGAPNPDFGHSFSDMTADDQSDQDTPAPGALLGETGAMARNTLIGRQEARAYQAGAEAPRIDFDGTLHRTIPTSRGGSPAWEGYADHRWSDMSGGRYQDPGQRLIYASPSQAESLQEMSAYGSMADQTMVDFGYKAPIDPVTGTGGVADVSNHMSDLGLTPPALTGEKGGAGRPIDFNFPFFKDPINNFLNTNPVARSLVGGEVGKYGPNPLNLLTGESPYTHSRALGQGVADSGASGMLVPSATGGSQLDIIPRNTDPSQIQYESHTPYDANGSPLPTVADPAHLAQHAPQPGGGTGPGVMPAGDAPVPHAPVDPVTSPGATARAGSLRYGLAGGVAGSLINDVIGGRGPSLDTAGDLALQGGVGMGGGVVQDALHARLGGGFMGGMGAAGAIGALTSGAFSAYDNGEAYRQGKETAGQATANTVVDAGVGLGAGLTGAATGAAIGSVIPIAGTAVGAGIGFLGGMAAGYGANWLAQHSGVADWAKQGLGGVLNNYNGALGHVWNGVGTVTGGIHSGWEATKGGMHQAGSAVADTASSAWHGAENMASGAAQGIGTAAHSVGDAASAGWHKLTGWL